MTPVPYKMVCRDTVLLLKGIIYLPRDLSVYFFQILTFLMERLNFTNIKATKYQGGIGTVYCSLSIL